MRTRELSLHNWKYLDRTTRRALGSDGRSLYLLYSVSNRRVLTVANFSRSLNVLTESHCTNRVTVNYMISTRSRRARIVRFVNKQLRKSIFSRQMFILRRLKTPTQKLTTRVLRVKRHTVSTIALRRDLVAIDNLIA